jgi:hypothetical protein
MLMTLREVREIILEAFIESIPSKEKIEQMLDAAGDDKLAISRIFSLLLRRFPPTSKLLIQNLGRTVFSWKSGRASYNDVERAIDKLYASIERKKASYASSYPRMKSA